MEKSFRALVPLIIWTAFPLLILHTMLYAKPTYCYDGREGLFVCGLTPVENCFYNWGYADEHGRKVIPCKYRAANPFDKNERAIVSDGERDYLITTSGRIIAKNSYKRVTEYDEEKGLYLINGGRCANIIDKNGKCLLKGKYDRLSNSIYDTDDYFSACKDGKYGVIDCDENTIIPFEYDDRIYGSSEQLHTVRNGKAGIININNEVLVPFEYDDVYSEYNSDGLYCVRINDDYGLIDSENNIVVTCRYRSVSVIDGQWYRIGTRSGYGIMDKNGDMIIPAEYGEIEHRDDGTWAAYYEKHKYIFTESGSPVMSYRMDDDFVYRNSKGVEEPDEKREYAAEIREKAGLGSDFEVYRSDEEGLCTVFDKKERKYGLLDTESGEFIVEPVCDMNVYFNNDGLAVIKEGRSVRVVNRGFETVYETECECFDLYGADDYIRMYDKGRCTIMDKDFNKLYTIKANYVSSFEDDGYAVFTRESSIDFFDERLGFLKDFDCLCFLFYEQSGVVREDGKIMFTPRYVGIEDYNDDGA